MTQSEEAVRANRDGDPCPPWCTTPHDVMTVDGDPRFGYLSIHASDYMVTRGGAVKVTKRPGAPARLRVDGGEQFHLTPAQAETLAEILEAAADGPADLAGQLRCAASVARDTP